MNSRAWAVSGLVLACATIVGANDARAFCRMTTQTRAQIGSEPCGNDGVPLEWKNTCLSYAIDSRGSASSPSMSEGDIASAVEASFGTWMEADCNGFAPNVIFKAQSPSTCRRSEFNENGPNVNTIAFLNPWIDPCAGPGDLPYDEDAFAVTIVHFNTGTGEILDADMMINDTMASPEEAGGPYDNCPDSGCDPGTRFELGPADLASIVTHEAGHFIGIGHSEVVDATMYFRADRVSVTKRTLEPDDVEAICTIYPPGDLVETCDETPRGGLQLNCETDAQGNLLSCDAPSSSSSGGCSASSLSGPSDVPWALVLASLLGLTAMWRRLPRRVARS